MSHRITPVSLDVHQDRPVQPVYRCLDCGEVGTFGYFEADTHCPVAGGES